MSATVLSKATQFGGLFYYNAYASLLPADINYSIDVKKTTLDSCDLPLCFYNPDPTKAITIIDVKLYEYDKSQASNDPLAAVPANLNAWAEGNLSSVQKQGDSYWATFKLPETVGNVSNLKVHLSEPTNKGIFLCVSYTYDNALAAYDTKRLTYTKTGNKIANGKFSNTTGGVLSRHTMQIAKSAFTGSNDKYTISNSVVWGGTTTPPGTLSLITGDIGSDYFEVSYKDGNTTGVTLGTSLYIVPISKITYVHIDTGYKLKSYPYYTTNGIQATNNDLEDLLTKITDYTNNYITSANLCTTLPTADYTSSKYKKGFANTYLRYCQSGLQYPITIPYPDANYSGKESDSENKGVLFGTTLPNIDIKVPDKENSFSSFTITKPDAYLDTRLCYGGNVGVLFDNKDAKSLKFKITRLETSFVICDEHDNVIKEILPANFGLTKHIPYVLGFVMSSGGDGGYYSTTNNGGNGGSAGSVIVGGLNFWTNSTYYITIGSGGTGACNSSMNTSETRFGGTSRICKYEFYGTNGYIVAFKCYSPSSSSIDLQPGGCGKIALSLKGIAAKAAIGTTSIQNVYCNPIAAGNINFFDTAYSSNIIPGKLSFSSAVNEFSYYNITDGDATIFDNSKYTVYWTSSGTCGTVLFGKAGFGGMCYLYDNGYMSQPGGIMASSAADYSGSGGGGGAGDITFAPAEGGNGGSGRFILFGTTDARL